MRRLTRAQASCNAKLKKYIAVLYHKYENPKQAIAVAYSITKRKFNNCNRYLQRRRRQPVAARRRRRNQPLRRSERIRNRRR